jgi:outer membrane protein assembly factor BamD (BamD/ComL family)
MGEGSYFNFDLIVERAGERYRARVFDSPAGQAVAEFEMPFSELELENFVLRMGRPRTGVRRVDSSEMEAVKQCGERLFRAVFSDDVYASFLRSRDTALEEEKGLRVRLRIDVPEFHDYPWEFLYNAHMNQFLALSTDTPVVRYMELPYPVQPLTVQPPLKILVMISSPEGFPQLNVEEEWRRLSNALAPLLRRGLVTLERLKNPTLSALQQYLRRGEYHIFHFVGHGKFSEHKQDGMLLLEDENGGGRPISGQYLGTILHDHRSLRLVVLNACEGARTSREDPYAGVAQTLVLQGIPAVIAMQFEIVETAAITFAQEFYGAVADGFPVDAAVSEARKAIFARGNDVEWGTPVLYMRTPQGVIFEIPEALRTRQPATDESVPYVDKELEQKLQGLYTEGLAAFWVEDWDRACDRFQRILADRPDHAAAADKLAEAKRQRRLSNLYARASEAQSAENWPVALKTLEELLKDSPEYKDAATTLKIVKKKNRLAELYTEAKQLHAAKKWQAVAKVFAQIKSIDPDYPDPDNLLPTAEKELDELKRQTELNELYSRAVHEMDAGQWGEAQRLLKQIQGMEPGFLETERLLSKVDTEIWQSEEEQKRQNQINTLYEQAHGLLRSKKWRQALEKIEEIRKLDEKFEDSENIAERAQKELAREEQEAERQNELAAMYAEAVRLLRAEKYQEALEKWQEIKGIDAKYPDRQKVQRTARKSLSALAKPVTGKRRLAIPKSLWIGLGGIVIIGVIILALVLPGKNGEEPSSPAISAPTSVSGGKVVSPTATKTPVKASSTSRPTAMQATSGYADPTMYDDFDNVAYNGKVNDSLWLYGGDTSYMRVFQENGSSVFTVSEANNCPAIVVNNDYNPITQPMFIEARMMLDPESTIWGTDLGITFNAVDGHSVCSIFPGQDTQEISCWSKYFGVDQRDYKVGIAPGSWHILRIELYPDTMQFSYLVDGEEIGAYIPRNSEAMKNIEYELLVRLCNWGGYAQNPVGYLDYFKVGSLE